MSLNRSLARRAAVQAIYQWQLGKDNLPELEQQFVDDLKLLKQLYQQHRAGVVMTQEERSILEDLLEKHASTLEHAPDELEDDPSLETRAEHCQVPDVHVKTFKDLLNGCVHHVAQLDEILGEFLDRAIEDVDPVERAILRLGCYELMHRPDMPYRVPINEAINLAKEFGAVQSFRYINGILDKVARKHRAVEIAMKSGRGRS